MAHDVFISHSNIDKAVAHAACATFEQNGIRCWIAPRDVPGGSEWAEAIIDAIETSKVMVLIFSTHSNESRQVRREIELAVSRGLTIMPLRLEQIEPTRSMAYYMAGVHWIDALTPPLDAHFKKMVEWIKPHVGGSTAKEPPPRAEPKPPPKAPPESKAKPAALTVEEVQRLYDAARALATSGRRPDAVTAFRQLIARIGEPADAPMRAKLAMIQHSLALNLENLGSNEEAVAAFDDMVRRYRKTPDAVLSERIAMVLVDRANPLNTLGRWKEALASYDELMALFGSSKEPGVIAQLARSGVCRGIILGEAGKNTDAIGAYDVVIQRYQNTTDARLLEIVATALYNRAGQLEALGRKRDAVAGCEEIVRRLSSRSEEKLQHQVNLAQAYLAKLR